MGKILIPCIVGSQMQGIERNNDKIATRG